MPLKKTIYEQDFQAWALENAALLRQGNLADIDVLHIAEELEGMGASERRELQSPRHCRSPWRRARAGAP